MGNKVEIDLVELELLKAECKAWENKYKQAMGNLKTCALANKRLRNKLRILEKRPTEVF